MKSYDNFFLPVTDLQQAKEFYQDLGLCIKFDFSKQGMLAFQVGQDEPAIILKDVHFFPETKPTIWFEVEDVRKEYQRLREQKVVCLTEPFWIRTGLAVEFEDPFGNRLGITDYQKKENL